MQESIKQKKVLFISTKNADYIRNVQERRILKELSADYEECVGEQRSYVKRLVYVFFWLLTHSVRKYDVILIGFAPQLILPFFYWKFKKKQIVADFFISLYDTFIHDRKKWKEGSFFAKRLHALDRKTIAYADLVIVDTKAHGAFFCEEFGLCSNHQITLYLEADRDVYYPRDNPKQQTQCAKYTVLYFGSVLPLQGVDTVLKAMRILREEEDLQFIFIGPLDEKQKKIIEGQKNICLYEWLSQEQLAEQIAQSDLCLAGHFNSEIKKAQRTIPGKAYIYRSMEKKMILGDCLANRELFDEGETCAYVPQGDAAALANQILMSKEKNN